MKYPKLIFFLIFAHSLVYAQTGVTDTTNLEIDSIKQQIDLLQNQYTVLEDSIVSLNEKVSGLNTNDTGKLQQFSTNWIPFLSFLVALITIFFGWKAIVYNRKVKRYELIVNITTEYASEEMLAGILRLRSWEEENIKAEKSFSEEFGILRKSDYEKVKDIDIARRRIAHFFYRIHLLHENKVIDKNEIMNIITVGQIDLLQDLIMPLDMAISTDYNKKMFVFFTAIKTELQKTP